jgi:hypothetical protein
LILAGGHPFGALLHHLLADSCAAGVARRVKIPARSELRSAGNPRTLLPHSIQGYPKKFRNPS